MNNQITSFLKIKNTPCGKLRNCTFSLLSKPLENRIIKRNMRTLLNKLGTHLTNTSHSCLPKTLNLSKKYATQNVQKPDPNNPNPQALVNNPPVGATNQQHHQIVRGICAKEDCKEQDCGPLLIPNGNKGNCGETVTTFEGTGHMTSGNPKVPQGKVVPLDLNTNMIGANNPQNFVVYNNPHSTGITSESFPTPGKSTGKGTDFLHDPQNPHRINTVIQETKTK